MPGVLVRLLEVAGAFPNSSRNRDLTGFRDEDSLLQALNKRTGSYVCSARTFVNNSGINFSTVYG